MQEYNDTVTTITLVFPLCSVCSVDGLQLVLEVLRGSIRVLPYLDLAGLAAALLWRKPPSAITIGLGIFHGRSAFVPEQGISCVEGLALRTVV